MGICRDGVQGEAQGGKGSKKRPTKERGDEIV